jgi:hypothetical protein
VKLLRANKGGFVFHIGTREHQLLVETLKLYPLVPAAHHRVGKPSQLPNADETQRLLDEALAEQRSENRAQVLALFNDSEHFRKTDTGFDLTLTPPQVEWLLQVLNDVRVGSWLALGEPEQGEEPEVNENNMQHLLALEVCGMYQSVLLAALGVEQMPHWH